MSDKNDQIAERKSKFERMRAGMEEMRRRAEGGSAEPSPSTAGAREYVVRPGDSLSAIAKALYGDAGRWREIYAANQGVIGADPNLIRPGQKLHIP